jgi:outer membrane protein TolC
MTAAMVLAAFDVVRAQESLTLPAAMARARTATPAARALAAGAREADERVIQARAGYLPRVDLTQSVERGDQPVFVFGSVLAQRRFTAANFGLAALNYPPATTNVRTAVTVDQVVFDGGRTGARVLAAGLAREVVHAEQTRGQQDLALAAAEAFVRVLQLESAVQAADAAVAAATSDGERARSRRDVGVVTDADVLAIEVHLADVQQRRIAAMGDLAVARFALNDAVGLPLDQAVTLVRPVPRAVPTDPAALTNDALLARAELQQATLRARLAGNDRHLAQATFMPTVGVQGTWEFNGNTWLDQRSAWLVGAQLRINIFNGFADKARLGEARQAELRAAAERDRVAGQIAVDVRGALTRLDSARAREAAGRAALAQARESQRIVRDRYDAGLATVSDVLRAAEAVVEADSRATAAEMDVILQDVALDRALGRL